MEGRLGTQTSQQASHPDLLKTKTSILSSPQCIVVSYHSQLSKDPLLIHIEMTNVLSGGTAVVTGAASGMIHNQIYQK